MVPALGNQPNFQTICTNQPDGTRIRDVANCNQYFICQRGEPSRPSICPFPQFFNPLTSLCADRSLVTCFSCPNDTFIDMPADRQCNQFIRCFKKVPRQMVCAKGLLFDPVLKACNKAPVVDCACASIDNPAVPEFWPDRNNCSKFYVCLGGKRIPQQCSSLLHFNTKTNQCDFPENANCNLDL